MRLRILLFTGALVTLLEIPVPLEGRGVDVGLCDETRFDCLCGSPGYSFQVPVSQCTYFYRWKPSCKPCDKATPGTICPKYSDCRECSTSEDRCVTCPPDKFGQWCKGTCNCQNGATCDRSTGNCICPAGFKGPNCETQEGCSPPSVPPGVEEKRIPTSSPKKIEYSCLEGFLLKGPAAIDCLPNGKWTGNPPTCEILCPVPDPIVNGEITLSNRERIVGTIMRHNCLKGYYLIGHNERRCLADGTWEGVDSTCKKLSFCSDPGKLTNGNRVVMQSISQLYGEFPTGSEITYTCEGDRILVGAESMMCEETKRWSAPLPICVEVSDKILNCDTTGLDVLRESSAPLIIRCPPGCADVETIVMGTAMYYELSSICQAAIHAGKITNFGGSTYLLNNGYYTNFIGSEANGIRSEVYNSRGRSFRFDHPEGTDVLGRPSSKDCPPEWHEIKGNICFYLTQKIQPWEKARGICHNMGAKLATADDAVKQDLSNLFSTSGLLIGWIGLHRVARIDGWMFTWVGNEEEGVPVKGNDTMWAENEPGQDDCVVLDINKGTSVWKTWNCHQPLPYACMMELSLKNAAKCPDPGSIEGGTAVARGQEPDGFYTGSSITYKCKELHYLQGEPTIICTMNGVWNRPQPVCVKVPTCKKPPVPENAILEMRPAARSIVSVVTVVNGTQVTRQSRIGTPNRNRRPLSVPSNQRQRQSLQGGPLPEAQQTSDPAVDVEVPKGHFSVGARASFSCQSRYYTLVGSSTRRCLNDGTWSGRPITCIPRCGISDAPRKPFIVNGNATDIGQWPWQSALARIQPDDTLFVICGGSLVSEHWVITAAHCVTEVGTNEPIPPSEYTVYLGKYYRDDAKDDNFVQIIMPQEIHVHPDYDPNQYDADVALIHLSKPAVLTPRVQPVCIPTERSTEHNIVKGKRGVVTGWGLNEVNVYSETMQQAEMPVVPRAECEDSYKEAKLPLTVTENMYCSGFPIGRTDSCSGDSGGPMVFPEDSGGERRWILEGIVSWGSPTGCGNANQYSGFAKVSAFLDWIRQFI